MPIRRSAGGEIRQLIVALDAADEVTRESAVARLAVLGTRGVEALVREYPGAPPRVRAGLLRAFEATSDPRVAGIARMALDEAAAPTVIAAIGVLRAFLNSPRPGVARDALDGIVGVALDTSRSATVRLAALDALRDLPSDVRDSVRAQLAADADADVRSNASPRPAGGADEESVWRAAVDDGSLPASPATMKKLLAARRAPGLTELQHLVDHLRAREHGERDPATREEWRAVRGAVHQALAARNSRLALYDLRDSLLEPERLPVAFLAALEEIGDATCLETLAAAYDASSRSGDVWWREHVATAFRAIVQREGLTRRHVAVKRTLARWPEAGDLLGK